MANLEKAFFFRFKGIEVTDGDTVKCLALDFGFGFGKLTPTRVRIAGVDAPETKLKAGGLGAREKACGLKIKGIIEKWFAERPDAVLISQTWEPADDKYGGRIIGDFGVPDVDLTLSEFLLVGKLAHAYGGEKKKAWTDAELALIEAYHD